jgi:hypothetical protein
MRILIAVIAVAAFTVTAAAQNATPMQPTTKPVDCRAEAKTKGLSGQAAKDSVALCRQELRTACLKEAIDKKITGKERRDFIRTCSARPKGGEGRKS